MRSLGLLYCLVSGYAAMAHAGDVRAAGRCVVVDDSAARLACYDAAFSRSAAVPTPTGTGGQVAPPAAVTAAPPLAGFGDNGQLTQERRARDKLPRKIDAKIVAVTTLSGGLYRLTLDNEQIWATREADFGVSFAPADAVTVTRMALGGYQISRFGQGRSVGARRIQ